MIYAIFAAIIST